MLVVAGVGVAVAAEWDAGVAGSKADACAEPAGAIEQRNPRSFRALPRPNRKCSAP